jgi:hypothetical protein
VSVRGGEEKEREGDEKGVFECVKGRERETKRVDRERVRRRGEEKVWRGRCMRERVER